MFKKKVPQVVASPLDEQYRKLCNNLNGREIRNQVVQVFIKDKAVELYPEGADKDAAKKEAEVAKERLRNCVAAYDLVWAELHNFYYANVENFTSHVWHPDRFSTSHEQVEIATRNFLFGNTKYLEG